MDTVVADRLATNSGLASTPEHVLVDADRYCVCNLRPPGDVEKHISSQVGHLLFGGSTSLQSSPSSSPAIDPSHSPIQFQYPSSLPTAPYQLQSPTQTQYPLSLGSTNSQDILNSTLHHVLHSTPVRLQCDSDSGRSSFISCCSDCQKPYGSLLQDVKDPIYLEPHVYENFNVVTAPEVSNASFVTFSTVDNTYASISDVRNTPPPPPPLPPKRSSGNANCDVRKLDFNDMNSTITELASNIQQSLPEAKHDDCDSKIKPCSSTLTGEKMKTGSITKLLDVKQSSCDSQEVVDSTPFHLYTVGDVLESYQAFLQDIPDVDCSNPENSQSPSNSNFSGKANTNEQLNSRNVNVNITETDKNERNIQRMGEKSDFKSVDSTEGLKGSNHRTLHNTRNLESTQSDIFPAGLPPSVIQKRSLSTSVIQSPKSVYQIGTNLCVLTPQHRQRLQRSRRRLWINQLKGRCTKEIGPEIGERSKRKVNPLHERIEASESCTLDRNFKWGANRGKAELVKGTGESKNSKKEIEKRAEIHDGSKTSATVRLNVGKASVANGHMQLVMSPKFKASSGKEKSKPSDQVVRPSQIVSGIGLSKRQDALVQKQSQNLREETIAGKMQMVGPGECMRDCIPQTESANTNKEAKENVYINACTAKSFENIENASKNPETNATVDRNGHCTRNIVSQCELSETLNTTSTNGMMKENIYVNTVKKLDSVENSPLCNYINKNTRTGLARKLSTAAGSRAGIVLGNQYNTEVSRDNTGHVDWQKSRALSKYQDTTCSTGKVLGDITNNISYRSGGSVKTGQICRDYVQRTDNFNEIQLQWNNRGDISEFYC